MMRMVVQRRQYPPDAALLADADPVVGIDSETPPRPTRLLHHAGMIRMVVQRF